MLRQKFFCIKANYRKDKLPNFSRNNVIYKVNCQNTYGAVCHYSVPFRVHDFNELFFFLFVCNPRHYINTFRFWFRMLREVGNFRANVQAIVVQTCVIIRRISWPLLQWIILFLSLVISDIAFIFLDFLTRRGDRDLCLKCLDIHWKFLDTYMSDLQLFVIL